MPVGIPNISGNLCHASSALILLHKCLTPLSQAILHDVQTNACTDDLTHAIGRLLSEIDDEDVSEETVMHLQAQMLRSLKIDPGKPRDLVNTFLKLVNHVIASSEHTQVAWSSHVAHGEAFTVLKRLSITTNGEPPAILEQKRKPTKMPTPLRVIQSTSLLTSLQLLLQPKHVRGYKWEGCEVQQSDTTKQFVLSSLPNYLLIHIDRSSPLTSMSMHTMLDSASLGCENQGEYRLNGVVLFEDRAGMKGGHYYIICRSEDEKWIQFDDDHVSSFDEEAVVAALESGNGDIWAGHPVLLCYQRFDCKQDSLTETQSTIDWSRPHLLVGECLHLQVNDVRHACTVASFDMTTGRHTLLFANGDTQEMILRKEDIAWD